MKYSSKKEPLNQDTTIIHNNTDGAKNQFILKKQFEHYAYRRHVPPMFTSVTLHFISYISIIHTRACPNLFIYSLLCFLILTEIFQNDDWRLLRRVAKRIVNERLRHFFFFESIGRADDERALQIVRVDDGRAE